MALVLNYGSSLWCCGTVGFLLRGNVSLQTCYTDDSWRENAAHNTTNRTINILVVAGELIDSGDKGLKLNTGKFFGLSSVTLSVPVTSRIKSHCSSSATLQRY